MADYTGSGGVWSWKAGLDWQVFRDVRLRGTISRDLRAATLLERYNQTGGVGTATDSKFASEGNSDLLGPHRRQSQSDARKHPRHIPPALSSNRIGYLGLSASFDYWKVNIDGAIGTLGFQRIVDDCNNAPGSAECAYVTRDPNPGTHFNHLSQVINITQNIAAAAGRGFDVEIGYRRPIHVFGPGENLSLRLFWSRMLENSTTSDRSNPRGHLFRFLRARTTCRAIRGPRFKATISVASIWHYQSDILARVRSAGATIFQTLVPDVADNSVNAIMYVNLTGRYSFKLRGGNTMEVFANVENLFDQDPPLTPSLFDASLSQTGSQVSSYYDLLGRRFTIGVKIRH